MLAEIEHYPPPEGAQGEAYVSE